MQDVADMADIYFRARHQYLVVDFIIPFVIYHIFTQDIMLDNFTRFTVVLDLELRKNTAESFTTKILIAYFKNSEVFNNGIVGVYDSYL